MELVSPSKPRKVPGGDLFVTSKLNPFGCLGVLDSLLILLAQAWVDGGLSGG